MFSKYFKENALEDMKVELSKMKTEVKTIEHYNEVCTDLKRDVLMFERFIELSESEKA